MHVFAFEKLDVWREARKLEIAYGSLMETLSQLLLSVDLGYLSEEKLNNSYRIQIEKISNQLNALRKSRLQ